MAICLPTSPPLRAVSDAASLLINSLDKEGHIYSCGNGGSMCDAMHFAEEMTGALPRQPGATCRAGDCRSVAPVVRGPTTMVTNMSSAVSLKPMAERAMCCLASQRAAPARTSSQRPKAARDKGMSVIAMTGRPGRSACRTQRRRHLYARRTLRRPGSRAAHQGDPHPDRTLRAPLLSARSIRSNTRAGRACRIEQQRPMRRRSTCLA